MHLSVLSSCSSLLEGYTVGLHSLVSAWVKGHRAEFPHKKTGVPPWNLSSVLVALTEGDSEPLTETSMEFATYKIFVPGSSVLCKEDLRVARSLHRSSFLVAEGPFF